MRTLPIVPTLIFMISLLSPQLAAQELGGDLKAQADTRLENKITFLIAQMKETETGKRFLQDHSEADLRKFWLFLQEPIERFGSIQGLHDPNAYLWAIQEYCWGATEEARVTGLNDFFGCLSANFQKADPQNVAILTHLLVNGIGVLGEEVADRYTLLFGSDPKLFIEDLEKRTNWEEIVRYLGAGDWRAFQEGLSKLGSSSFERKLKAFATSLDNDPRSSMAPISSPCPMPGLEKEIQDAFNAWKSDPDNEQKIDGVLSALTKAVPRYDCRRKFDTEPVPAWWLASYENINHWVDFLTTVLDRHYSPALKTFMEFYRSSDGYIAEGMTWQIVKMLRRDPIFILENWRILREYRDSIFGTSHFMDQDDIGQLGELYRGIAGVEPSLSAACAEIIEGLKKK